MAGRKHAYRFIASPLAADLENSHGGCGDEFEESDVWGLSIEPEYRKPVPARSSNRKGRSDKGDRDRDHRAASAAAASLPVNVPDWAKILKEEHRGNSYGSRLVDADEDDAAAGGAVVPPHELLWRSRAASLSVHEGIGRTLKGRDLRRVRNAIFEKTGFQD
ncbi:uncharacterized protein M6B38_361300 [Iris pallida]|uniref:Senescence regulator n=1 Tax=Iris pallida TaxID=29817 RepID=A0AAX6EZX6_IRIPA|nr:uncharacterized protein M6B38_162400 [Iris pallida]KAJ6828799.1 uncharacterized protein M6B38_361300 [Iris pallida]